MRVGYGSWQIASGTTSWSKSVILASGSNTIYARATDTSGNTKETSVMVTYSPPDWNPWDDDCVISDSEISNAEYYWATNTQINGHTITDAEISLLEYQWTTGDVC